ncbi:MAG: hypothetical protein Phyf2KO_27110 [Phycisphaerales bacterium]
MTERDPITHEFEPLIYDSAEEGGANHKPKKRSKKEREPRRSVQQRWKDFVAARTSTPEKAKKFKRNSIVVGSLAFLAAGFVAYMTLRPYPQPDYEDDPLDEIFNYTLFQNEFNRLPVEERVRLVGSLVKRVEDMGGSDGTLLAAFAAGISGAAREQLEENASQLMLDFMDHFAKDYETSGDPAAQEDSIRQLIVDMTRLAEEFDGRPTKKSDEKILEEAFAQAERDQRAFRDPNRGPSLAGVSRFTNMMENRVGARGTPHQRARITRMMRDMTRYLRNEDLSTGEPKGGG